MFAEEFPYNTTNPPMLINDILYNIPDVTGLGLPPKAEAMLLTLLSKSPGQRTLNAQQAIAIYQESVSQRSMEYTTALRESYLLAADFIGRESELETLTTAFHQATQSKGSIWLIGGESGVGKSRLVDELRIRALVDGGLAIRSFGVNDGRQPYLIWRDVLRRMVLQVNLSDLEAAVLRRLIPDIESLIERPVSDLPPVEPNVAFDRLLGVIEEVFSRQTQPLLILLEDLQWVDLDVPEGGQGGSLAILNRIGAIVGTLPILIVGTYRAEDRPDLPDLIPASQSLSLNRLDHAAIAGLSRSMLGEQIGGQDQLVEFLARHTEGNVFFIIEAVRALAEEAGELALIGANTLPPALFAGGIQSVVQRRLDRVPQSARALLELAAVAGRQLDLGMLRAADPQRDLEAWLLDVTSVLQVQDNRLQFAHDKLREGLLASIDANRRADLHGQIALAIEATYSDLAEYVDALTFHWKEAGDLAKEAHYSLLAGQQALKRSAYNEGVAYLERAQKLNDKANFSKEQLINLHHALADSKHGLGQLHASLDHSHKALSLLGVDIPIDPRHVPPFVAIQGGLQAMHRAGVKVPLLRSVDPKQIPFIARILLDAGTQLGGTLAQPFASAAFIMVALNLVETQDDISSQLAEGYAMLVHGMRIVNIEPIAKLYQRLSMRALAELEKRNSVDDIGSFGSAYRLMAYHSVSAAEWEQAERYCQAAMDIFHSIGDQRRWREAISIYAQMVGYMGDFQRCMDLRIDTLESARRSTDLRGQVWALAGIAQMYFRMGHFEDALEVLEDRHRIMTLDLPGSTSWTYLSYAYYRLNRPVEARSAARRALLEFEDIGVSDPYNFYGLFNTAEAIFGLWDDDPSDTVVKRQAAQVMRFVRSFARFFKTGRPRRLVLEGRYALHKGRTRKALDYWTEAARVSSQIGMPYAGGVAHLYLSRHAADAQQRQAHRHAARSILSSLGAYEAYVVL
ncbi:MAG: AAA family ATPase, partial [Chloroflexi bacterium]|nr:AAA family ATPase [Chloroflexota bacterium]